MIIFTLKSYVPAGPAPPKSFSHPVFRTQEEAQVLTPAAYVYNVPIFPSDGFPALRLSHIIPLRSSAYPPAPEREVPHYLPQYLSAADTLEDT